MIESLINKEDNTNVFLKVYPVGSIYMSTTNTNPSSLFGGTWVSFGEGRTLIGAGSGTDANEESKTFEVNSTGGEYNHTLTVAEMPSHTHIQQPHDHIIGAPQNGSGSWSGWALNVSAILATNTNQVPTNARTAINNSTGGSEEHNNLPPYITTYMWKRTA